MLDDGQAKREMKNWVQVNPGGIGSALRQSGQGMDCFVVVDNAGQGPQYWMIQGGRPAHVSGTFPYGLMVGERATQRTGT